MSGDDREGFSSHLDEGDVNLGDDFMLYMKRAVQKLRQETFDDDKDKQLFVKNVFGELRGKEADVFRTYHGSCLMELLISAGNLSFLSPLCSSILKNTHDIFRIMCYNQHGSFVTQALLEIIPKILGDESTEVAVNGKPKLKIIKKFIESLGGFLLDNMAIAVRDSASSHVFRVFLSLLSGVPIPENLQRSNSAKRSSVVNKSTAESSRCETKWPKNFGRKIKEFTLAASKLFPLEEYICDPRSSVFLQYLIHVLAKTESKLFDNFFSTILPKAMSDTVMHDRCGSRMVEMLICTAPVNKLDDIWNDELREKFGKMSLHPISNFLVQKFIVKIPTEKMLKEAFSALDPHFETIFCKGYFGIIVALCESCANLSSHQEDIMQVLLKLYNCKSDKDFVCLLLYGKKYEQFQNSKSSATKVSYHGSCILQHILKFQKPAQLQAIRGLVALPTCDIASIVVDPSGSHVMDEFFKSPNVSNKDKSKLLTEFRGTYPQMACNKFGSRVLETIWTVATLAEKQVIAKELGQKKDQLNACHCGAIVARKFALKTFMEHPDSWRDGFKQRAKTMDLFQDIINPDGDQATSTKRKAGSNSTKVVAKKKKPSENK